MTDSKPQRIWDETLQKIEKLVELGVVPSQLSLPARIDYLIDVAAKELKPWPKSIAQYVAEA